MPCERSLTREHPATSDRAVRLIGAGLRAGVTSEVERAKIDLLNRWEFAESRDDDDVRLWR